MSDLSEKLKYYLSLSGMNSGELARRCGIDRSTVFQYLNGRRLLQNRTHLDAIIRELCLTPGERAEVMEAWEISRIGLKRFRKRKKIKEIISPCLRWRIWKRFRRPAAPETTPAVNSRRKVGLSRGNWK